MSDNERTPETKGPGTEPAAPLSSREPAPGTPAPASEEAIQAENARLADRLLRLQAEYDNFRKRSGRERTEWTDRAIEGLVLDLLPVLDAFDHALETVEKGADAAALAEGIRLTRRLLDGALRARGLSVITAVGEPFDASRHEAFASQPAMDGQAPGTVVAEILRGYRLGDRTIRPCRAMVAVAPAVPEAQGPGPEEE